MDVCRQNMAFSHAVGIVGFGVRGQVNQKSAPQTPWPWWLTAGSQVGSKYRLFAVYKIRHFLDFLIYYWG